MASGPTSAISIVVAVASIITTFTSLMVIIPFAFERKTGRDYPNLFIPFIAYMIFFLNIGFLIGIPYNYDPARYDHTPTCYAQWVFLGPGGITCLVLIFFYIFGLYEVVVSKRLLSGRAWLQPWIFLFSCSIGLLFGILIPLGFPFVTGEIFAASGPWCGIKSLLILTICFYLPVVPLCVAAIFLASRIIWVVHKTTKSAHSQPKRTGSTLEIKKKATERAKKLNGFYARVSIFVILYCGFTIGAFAKRINELKTTNWASADHKNDSAMGLSVLLPLLAFLETLVFLSTPKVSHYWRVRFFVLVAMKSKVTDDDDPTNLASGEKKSGSTAKANKRVEAGEGSYEELQVAPTSRTGDDNTVNPGNDQ